MTGLLLLSLLPLAMAMPFDVVKPPVLATYPESFIRSTMLPLSAAAYSLSPQKCLTNVLKGTLQRQITVKCDGFKGDTCSGFTAVAPSQKAIIVSFRGTTGFLQLVEEANDSLFHSKIKFIAGGDVNMYFYDAFMAVWNGGMKNDFNTLKGKYPGYEIWVTGHSLGGSMASIAASYIAATGMASASNIKLVTFGQPRTGDAAWASAHDRQFSYSYRLTHSHDMVPHIPLEHLGWSHHMTEVFYKGDMKPGSAYGVCAADESKMCSDGQLTDLSINDHLHYFDHDVSGYGDAGCVGNV